MVTQQISPWTIYDHHGNIVTTQHSQQKVPQIQPPSARKRPKVTRRVAKKQLEDRQMKINELLEAITKQKSAVNDKIDMLSCLKVLRHYLFEESNPVSQIKVHLPKIHEKSEKLQQSQVKVARPKHPHFYSQKLGIMNGMVHSALEDFSKIFVSASLQPVSKSKEIKPEFPRQKKSSSVLLEIRKQFSDNSLLQAIQQARRKQIHNNIRMSSVVNSYPT